MPRHGRIRQNRLRLHPASKSTEPAKSTEAAKPPESAAATARLRLRTADLCRLRKDIIDQFRRRRSRRIFELEHPHIRRRGQMRIHRADNLHQPANVRRFIRDDDRVARCVGRHIRIGIDQRRQVRLQLHRIGIANRNHLRDQLIGISNITRLTPLMHGNIEPSSPHQCS